MAKQRRRFGWIHERKLASGTWYYVQWTEPSATGGPGRRVTRSAGRNLKDAKKALDDMEKQISAAIRQEEVERFQKKEFERKLEQNRELNSSEPAFAFRRDSRRFETKQLVAAGCELWLSQQIQAGSRS